jgi:hypothetical protein
MRGSLACAAPWQPVHRDIPEPYDVRAHIPQLRVSGAGPLQNGTDEATVPPFIVIRAIKIKPVLPCCSPRTHSFAAMKYDQSLEPGPFRDRPRELLSYTPKLRRCATDIWPQPPLCPELLSHHTV